MRGVKRKAPESSSSQPAYSRAPNPSTTTTTTTQGGQYLQAPFLPQAQPMLQGMNTSYAGELDEEQFDPMLFSSAVDHYSAAAAAPMPAASARTTTSTTGPSSAHRNRRPAGGAGETEQGFIDSYYKDEAPSIDADFETELARMDAKRPKFF